jgi:hypothetical protein
VRMLASGYSMPFQTHQRTRSPMLCLLKPGLVPPNATRLAGTTFGKLVSGAWRIAREMREKTTSPRGIQRIELIPRPEPNEDAFDSVISFVRCTEKLMLIFGV